MVDFTANALQQHLRTALDAAGITNATLANKLGVTEQAVGKWLRTGNVSRQHLPGIARVLGISIDWMLTGTGRGPSGYAPEFQAGDLLTVRPLAGDEPRSKLVVAAGRSRSFLLDVVPDLDGIVFINRNTGQQSKPGDVRVIGEVVALQRQYVPEQPGGGE